VLYVKDLLVLIRRKEPIELAKLIRPAYFVPETKRINTLLKQFQRKHMHIAIVSDEFGGVSGIVTIEDIVEELVGEIQDEYDEEQPIVEKVSDTEFKVQTSAAISDVNDYLPYPLPKSEDYETVGGLINLTYGAIPDVNEIAVMAPYEFKVLEKTQRNIEVVLLRVMQPDEVTPAPDQEEE
jgi:CBS domain containing-hemolysin-like protein